jgi:hypothetical protein
MPFMPVRSVATGAAAALKDGLPIILSLSICKLSFRNIPRLAGRFNDQTLLL